MKVHACLEPAKLRSLLEQSLPVSDAAACEHHLENCPSCRNALEQMAGEAHWWQDAAEMLSTDHDWNPAGDSTSEWNGATSKYRDSHEDAKTATLKRVRQFLQAPSHPEMLGRLASYDVESFIGQGGFGVVLRAFDRELNRPVAIKVLAPHLATIGAARRRFAREAQAAAAVVHPNVVPIHAVHADAEHPFLVMTFVPGCSLQEHVRRHGPLEPKAVVRIAQQVAAGLAAAHRQGLVHRDIKPGNILLENGLDRALITDFGLARAADDAASQTGWLAGTPHYMSPEQAASGDLDGRSDLFSLGSVMYFMATGREPFRGEQPLAVLNQIANRQPLSIRSVNSEIPRTLARIIDRLLEKRAADRFQSAAEVNELLERYLAYLQQPQTRAKPNIPGGRRQRLWVTTSILFAGSLLLTSAAAYHAAQVYLPPATVSQAMTEETKQIDFNPAERTDADRLTMAQFVELQQALTTWEKQSDSLNGEIQSLGQAIEQVENDWRSTPRDTKASWYDAFYSDRAVHEAETMLRQLEAAFEQ